MTLKRRPGTFARTAAASSGETNGVLYSSANASAGSTVPRPAAAAYEQRRPRLLHRLRLRRRVFERVVPAVEVDALLRPEPVDDLDLLGEHLDPRPRLREREAVRAVLALHPAGAEPELDPAARHVVGGRHRVREQPRQAEGRGGDERAEAQRRGACREGGDRRPRVVRDVVGLVSLRDVVIRAEERVDAVLLARVRERAPVLPGHAFLPLDHEREPHGASVSVSGRGRSGTTVA